jgi:Core-2/I-Branching enzyme
VVLVAYMVTSEDLGSCNLVICLSQSTPGMHMHVGSQWFSLPRHAVIWLLENPLPKQYESYAQHVVVADENYFSTLISNSPYCGDIIRTKNTFLLFDKWENELNGENTHTRDLRKCLSPDPEHCGRSPSTLTVQFKQLLEISHALFARKFNPLNAGSLELLDAIDTWRNMSRLDTSTGSTGDKGKNVMVRFIGLRPEKLPLTPPSPNPSASANTNSSSGCGTASDHTDDHSNNANLDATEVDLDITGDPRVLTFEPPDVMENYDFCWTMGGVGQPLNLAACDAALASQWFTVGDIFDTFSPSRLIRSSFHDCPLLSYFILIVAGLIITVSPE